MAPAGSSQAEGTSSSQDCSSSFPSTLLSLVFGKGHSLLDQVAFDISMFIYLTTSSVPAPEVLLGLAL